MKTSSFQRKFFTYRQVRVVKCKTITNYIALINIHNNYISILPFNINLAAIEAGVAALSDNKFYLKSVKHNSYYLEWLKKEIINLGLIPIPSVANFILVKFPGKGKFTAKNVNNYLLSKGIILRGVEAYGLKDFLRISIGKINELASLIKFLKIYFKKK